MAAREKQERQTRVVWRMIEVKDGGLHVIGIAVVTHLTQTDTQWERRRYRELLPGQNPSRKDRLMANGTIVSEREYQERRKRQQAVSTS